MATISRLVVEISAQSKKLKRNLDSAFKNVVAFSKRVAKQMAIVGGLITAALVGAFAKVTSSIRDTADEIDKLAKTSAKLNVSVGALQKLQFQANLTGVSTETLNTSLQRMVRRVSEAAKGTGEAKKALAELGLDAKALNRLAPDQQFNKIAQAMSKIPSQADKVRLAMRLFDTEGVALVNTLNSNLDQTGKEFDKLGIAITNQQAAAVEAFNDAQTKLSALWDSFFTQLTVQTAPAFTGLINFVTDVIKEMGGMGNVAKIVANVVIGAVKGMIRVFNGLLNALDSVIIGFKQIQIAANRAQSFLEVTNPLNIARNLISGETPESFTRTEQLRSDIERIRGRQATRSEFAERAINQANRAQIDITVSANKDAVVQDIKTSGVLEDAAVKAQVNQITKQARINAG